MNYYIYETENLINGKKYIGKRCTDRSVFNDYYLGSGINLNKAIEKYGKENFRKQILEICSSKKELSEKEKQYIEKVDAPNNPMYYNISAGGDGGNTYAGKTEEELKEIVDKIQKNRHLDKHTEESRRKMSKTTKERYKKENHPLYGKHHSKETKEKLSKKLKGCKFSEERNKMISEKTKGGKNHNARKVECIETGEKFECIADVTKKYGIDRHKIIDSCRNKRKSGILINDLETHWKYID